MNAFRIATLACGLALAVGMSGCATTPAVASFKGTPVSTVSGISLSCSSPYALTQNCSAWSGASLRVQARNQVVKVAGSADGKVVFVMSDKSSAPSQFELEQAVDAVQQVAGTTGAKTVKIEAVAVGAMVAGFIVTFDADAYAALKRNAIPAS